MNHDSSINEGGLNAESPKSTEMGGIIPKIRGYDENAAAFEHPIFELGQMEENAKWTYWESTIPLPLIATTTIRIKSNAGHNDDYG